jgi:hypothetical protein
MSFWLIERLGVSGQYSWRVTLHSTLNAAREMGNASAFDFLIQDHTGPVEYRIA